jgi:hypothetical protein
MAAGQLAQVPRRHRRAVAERLAVVAHDRRQEADHVRLDHQLVVLGPVALGHQPRERQLVVGAPRLGEADREGLHRGAARARHARHHDRRVDASGEESAQGHVGHQPVRHRLLDGLPDAGRRLGLVQVRQRGGEAGPVVAAHQRRAAAAQLQRVARRQLLHAPVDGVGGRHVLQRQVGVQRRQRQVGGRALVGHQRPQLGREDESVRTLGVEQRLLAESVARQQQRVVPRVPYRQREHPPEQLGYARPDLLVEVRHHLGVAAAAEPVALGQQVGAELGVVVDLAVDDDRDAAVLVGHRLPAGVRQVDDREAPVGQRDGAAREEAVPIGAAVDHGRGEPLGRARRGRRVRARRQRPRDAAHQPARPLAARSWS